MRREQDMRRFFEAFEILQTPPVEFGNKIYQPLANKSFLTWKPHPKDTKSYEKEIDQTVPDQSENARILQALTAESKERLLLDFRKHFHLGWTHYCIFLAISDSLKRKSYFDQTASQRWSKRELQRQIEGALFERVALSRNTRKLAALEKKKGPPETVRYEDTFKDPYLLDFLFFNDGKVKIEIKKEALPPPPPSPIPGRKMTNTVTLSPAEVQTLGEEIAQLTKTLAGCDPQVEARISIKAKTDKDLSKANEILKKIKEKWGF